MCLIRLSRTWSSSGSSVLGGRLAMVEGVVCSDQLLMPHRNNKKLTVVQPSQSSSYLILHY